METTVRAALAIGAALAVATPAFARSALVLPYPPSLGSIPAATYDDDGNRVGDAALHYRRDGDGRIRLRAESSMDDGPRNVIEAEFAELEDREGLRVLWQSSLSHDAQGKPMVLVEIDHEKREARCTPPGGNTTDVEVLELPSKDRVANAVMSLLFLPIARGEVDRVRFKAFLCRGGGARLVDFVALRGPQRPKDPAHQIVEVRFGPDLGRVASWFASVVVPKLRFWFDGTRDGDYLAHRMPLFGGGPEVVVMRDGVSARALRR
jgi:hypothetical protein